MCIIVAVPQDAPMPTIETLRECFTSNPDGAGFMWADGKRVHIRKGFMTFQEFLAGIDEEEIPEGSAMVMHFRIATHGKVSAECCHPFPVSSEPDDLRLAKFESRFGVAHNGVIQGRSTNNTWSDSMDFVANVIAPLARMNPSFIHNSNAIDMLEGACRSKLAIMDNAGDIALVGNFVEDGGVFYSNTSYLPTKYNWSSYGSLWERWTDATYEDQPWDDIDKLIEHLPWESCQLCDMAHDCAMWEAECESEQVAIQACSYYSGYDETETAELIGVVPTKEEYGIWDED